MILSTMTSFCSASRNSARHGSPTVFSLVKAWKSVFRTMDENNTEHELARPDRGGVGVGFGCRRRGENRQPSLAASAELERRLPSRGTEATAGGAAEVQRRMYR